jgi:D-alanyl-D-alanine carboxypeptidase
MNESIANRNDRVTKFLGGEIASSKYPGMQYLVVSGKERLFEYDGGYADVKNAISMSPATTMMAYSMTKTFTAAAVLQLVEQGKVSLDESVLHYLPTFPYGPHITVRHLLSQTSGLPNPIPLRWAHAVLKDPSFDESAALQAVMASHRKLSFTPGSRYAYSNLSYWLLGEIVEQCSGEPYRHYVERRIFTPLGLTARDAAFSIADGSEHAKGYLSRRSLMNLVKGMLLDKDLIGDNEDRWVHIRDHYLNGPAFGGLIATARGVSVFLQDLLRDHSVLLNPAFRNQFFAQQRSTGNASVPMTLGWHVGDSNGGRYFYKEGGGGGYHCEMRVYAERGIASVIMVNETSSSCTRTQDLADREFLTPRGTT